MVVFEIKNPAPIVTPPTTKVQARDVDPVFDIEMASHVKRFETVYESSRDQQQKSEEESSGYQRSHDTVREMVERVNSNLEKHGILVHLVLKKDNDGFSVDVYDCTSNEVCEIIRDMVVDLNDLPALIRKLQQETGFIVDTVS
jgi:uncharacterized FlaG/YvyC family protein